MRLAGLFENWVMPITQPKNTMFIRGKPKCLICNGTGLVPSKVLGKFSGKPIPNCFSDCVCREQEKGEIENHYRRMHPEDFDFPMSSTFRAFTYEYCGVPDPGYIPPELEERREITTYETSQPAWSKKQWDVIQQMQAELRGWRGKHAEGLLAIDKLSKKIKLYEGGDLI